MSTETVRPKVTDARLTECLKKDGGICPFCNSEKTTCVDSESQDDVVIERWACGRGTADGCGGEWRQILSLSEIIVDEDDAAEGETGHSTPVPSPLPPEVERGAEKRLRQLRDYVDVPQPVTHMERDMLLDEVRELRKVRDAASNLAGAAERLANHDCGEYRAAVRAALAVLKPLLGKE